MNFLKLFLNVSIFSLSFYLSSQNNITERDSLNIMKVMSIQEKAWNQGDIDSFMEGYLKSDFLVFSGSNGPVYGWNETKEKYKKSYPSKKIMGNLSFVVKNIKSISFDVALMIGEYQLKRSSGESSGYFTLVWKKINKKWLIVSDHTSSSK